MAGDARPPRRSIPAADDADGRRIRTLRSSVGSTRRGHGKVQHRSRRVPTLRYGGPGPALDHCGAGRDGVLLRPRRLRGPRLFARPRFRPATARDAGTVRLRARRDPRGLAGGRFGARAGAGAAMDASRRPPRAGGPLPSSVRAAGDGRLRRLARRPPTDFPGRADDCIAPGHVARHRCHDRGDSHLAGRRHPLGGRNPRTGRDLSPRRDARRRPGLDVAALGSAVRPPAISTGNCTRRWDCASSCSP